MYPAANDSNAYNACYERPASLVLHYLQDCRKPAPELDLYHVPHAYLLSLYVADRQLSVSGTAR
jgi:hypothetical protein